MIPSPSLPSSLNMTPPGIPGLTNSTAINLGTGGTVIGATNTLTNQAGGNQITFTAGLLAIVWHVLFPGQQSKRAHLGLLVVAVAFGILLFLVLGHLDPLEAVTRSAGVAVQSWANGLGLRIGGVDAIGAAPAPNLGG